MRLEEIRTAIDRRLDQALYREVTDVSFAPCHCRAGRAYLNWSLRDLAVAVGWSPNNIIEFEELSFPCSDVDPELIWRFHEAFRLAGVTFESTPEKDVIQIDQCLAQRFRRRHASESCP